MDSKKLKGRIIEKYGSMSAFAEALGCSRASVSGHITKCSFGQNTIEKWAKALDIDKKDYGIYFFYNQS